MKATPANTQSTINLFYKSFKNELAIPNRIRQEINAACTELVVLDCRPFKTINGMSFRNLAQNIFNVGRCLPISHEINIRNLLPHSSIVSRHADHLYDEKREQLITICQKMMRYADVVDFWKDKYTANLKPDPDPSPGGSERFQDKKRSISLKYDLHTKIIVCTRENEYITSRNKFSRCLSQTDSYSIDQKAIRCSYGTTLRASTRSSATWEKNTKIIPVTRTQLPIVPALALTIYKTQGLTMNKILVDLYVPPGTLQVASIYVPLSRVKNGHHTVIFRPLDVKTLQLQPTSAQAAALKRLDELDKNIKQECTSAML
ncbi:unnamed protein product [Adineta ricciae]|uniref:Hermes trasposase DNA-binding domain-containing protein n=1 Tax=Adineta ricciae TaxID=249248 RepID=A0A814WNW6_ADIRI|nr:unnamed protein product [Adineta ricciae]CAF1514959.1 unnamed protein product [Adineta ricciae]